MNEKVKKKNILTTFPRVFWTANMMEFFERGAYYGLNSVLAIYLAKHLLFREQAIGLLQGFVYALTYIVPVVGGALADRLGYRKMLLIAFSLLTVGYFAAGNFDTYGMIFLFLLVMATGSGLFKPIITGTVARTTTKENSGFGFGVYYWCINLGAVLGPLFIIWVKGFSWQYIFFFPAAWCFLMLLPTVFLYKDPKRPESTKTVQEVMKEALLVLGNSRFMLLIVVYSCFWILYFQMFGSVLWYMEAFIHRAPINEFMAKLGIPFKFDPGHVTVINALTIVLLVLVISRIVTKIKPVPVMAAGIVIGSSGFLILALTRSAWMFVLGIAVFSIGEMTAHPKYYSYVGLVAPQDKKAVYMGYAFLYGVFGSLFGSNFGAALYERFLKPVAPPAEDVSSGVPLAPEVLSKVQFFWLIFAVLGVVCLVGMLLYNRFFSEDTPKTNRRAWKIMLGLYSLFTIAGIYFFISSLVLSEQIQWRTFVQSLILLALGGGGVAISLKKKQ